MKARLIALTLLGVLALSACATAPERIPNETLTRYGAAGVWRLTEASGEPALIDLRVGFPSHNLIWVEGPCNSFSGLVTAPYPWFAIGPMQQTGRGCALLDAERFYMVQLNRMSQSEVLGNVLILSTEQGEKLIFNRLQ